MNQQTANQQTTDRQREQEVQRILKLYHKLSDEDKRRFNTFIQLLFEANGTPAREKITRFMHIPREGQDEVRAALDIMTVALRGNDIAWGIIDAELEGTALG